MDTRSFNYFIAVAEEQNISRAAMRLHISPSALTRQIQSLEEEFGVLLFIRTASGVHPTLAGQALLEHARKFRSQLEIVKSDVFNVSQQLTKRVDIGVNSSVMQTIMPTLLKSFATAHPNIGINLHTQNRTQQIDALRQGKILIGFDRYFPDEPDIFVETVCKESVVVVLYHGHPLVKKQEIQFSDLRDQSLIGPYDFTGTLAGIKKLFEKSSFEPQFAHHTDDVTHAATLVGCGLGITLAPASLQSHSLPNVVYRPLLTSDEVSWKTYCAYRRNEQSTALKIYLNCVRSYSQAEFFA